MIEPYNVLNDLGRKTVAFIHRLRSLHPPIVTQTSLSCQYRVSSSYFTRVLRLAYLAPDIVEAVVRGRQPVDLMANQLVRMQDLPLDWPSQREYLGFPAI